MAALAAAILGCDPGDGSKELDAGRAAYEARDFKKAEKLFLKSAQLAPQNVDALVYLARIKLDVGEVEEAQDWIAKAAELDGEAADVRLLGAQIAWHLKDYDRAAKLFTLVADDAKLPPETVSDAWAGLGIVEMTRGSSHLARVDFLRAIKINRRNAAAWYHLGLLYRDAPFGYLEAALEQMEIFVRLDTTASPRVQKTQRTIIPGLKESIARATAERPGAGKRNSTLCASAISKAEAAWKKGAYKDARQAYQEALSADALSYPAALGLAKAYLKTDATKDGQRKALDYYRQACVLRPGAVSTFLAAGELAAKLGFYAQAVEFHSRAVAANPSSIPAIDGLIKALRKVGGRQKEAAAYQSYRDSISKPKGK